MLEQAKDLDTPVLERLRFLTISSTNLDEFFEIQVGAGDGQGRVDPNFDPNKRDPDLNRDNPHPAASPP